LTHPRHEVERLYEVTVRGVPDERALQRLANGLVIDGRRTAPATVKLLPPRGTRAGRQSREYREDEAVLQLGLHEGRNRQVRNMCMAVGHPVRTLARVRIGPITDSRLKPGEFRDLRPAEVAALKHATGLSQAAKSETEPRSHERPHDREGERERAPRSSRDRGSSASAPTPSSRPRSRPPRAPRG
jgi:23S rRNA pseudouridine2605 synthase